MSMGLPSQRRVGHRVPMAKINVTPLAGVILVLLITFIVTAPLLVTGIPVELPESRSNGLEREQRPTIISVDSGGQIYIDENEVADIALPAELERTKAAQPQGGESTQIYLRGDKTLNYGRVMFVMGELHRAGLNRVSLVTTGPNDPVKSGNFADDRSQVRIGDVRTGLE